MNGHDAFGISKAETAEDKKRNRQGTALAGGGAALGTTGLIAGGIPGAKSDFTSVLRVNTGEGKGFKRAKSAVRGVAPAWKAAPGGILGFRTHAHQGGTADFESKHRANVKTKPKSASDAFYRGFNEGKIAPEHRVLRGMIKGKRAANVALGVGAATTAAGLHHRKKKDPVSKASAERRSDTYNAALAGAGGTTAVATHGVNRYLEGHNKAYRASAARNVDEAGKIAPSIAGRKTVNWGKDKQLRWMSKKPGQPLPKTMYPTVGDGAVKDALKGTSHRAAEAAGRLRGAATQDRHFAEVIGRTAKGVRVARNAAGIVAVAGAGGLVANKNRKDKQAVSKSAFGVDH